MQVSVYNKIPGWQLTLIRCFLGLVSATPVRGAGPVDVTGRVTDPQGTAVAEAKLTLTDPSGSFVQQTVADERGEFRFEAVEPGSYKLVAEADGLMTVSQSVSIAPGQKFISDIQFLKPAGQKQDVTVVAAAPVLLTPDPGHRILISDDILAANPGRPGAPVSIPGLPVETASGGIKAPQYFAPGVAGDHGEAIAQFYRVGDYLLPNNLPANAHGNGYSDPNFLISQGIGVVEVDGGAFNVREGNHAVDLAVAYGPRPRLGPVLQVTADSRDFDIVTAWSPANPRTHGWLGLEASFGNGFLKRPEHRQQYKLNAYRVYNLGRHEISVFGIGYYGFSRIPGLIPLDVPVPGDTVDPRQRERTHTSIGVFTDTWKVSTRQSVILAGFFRTYSLDLRSNFGEGLIKQSELRTVAGGSASYMLKVNPHTTLLGGLDLRRDAPRGLDLHRADSNGVFRSVTSNDLTLQFAAPFFSIDGPMGHWLHYDLGARREEISQANVDRIDPSKSFNKTQGITLPKGTLTLLPGEVKYFPTVALSFGEAFHTNDPRIGNGTNRGTVIVPSRAYQLVVKKDVRQTDFALTMARTTSSQELGKIDPDNGLQFDVGPSLIRTLALSARRYFSFGSLQVSWARGDAHSRLTRQPIPEAPRLIWDAVGTADRLPFHVRARGEFEYVGRKPLGDGFTAIGVREVRGALLRSFAGGKVDFGLNFLLAAGYTGQTTEVIALPTEPAPFERIVGLPLKSYVSVTCAYNWGDRERVKRR